MKRARRAVSQRAPDLENLAPRDDCARCSAGATASVGTNVRKPSTKTGPSRCGTKKWHLDGINLAAMRRKPLWRGGRAVECGGLEITYDRPDTSPQAWVAAWNQDYRCSWVVAGT